MNIDGFKWIISDRLGLIIEGIGVTLTISLIGTVIGLILALIVGSLRVQQPTNGDTKAIIIFKKIGNIVSKTYITIFRGTPMIVQAMIVYYGFAVSGNVIAPMTAGLITVTLNTTAYLAEVIRGGIQSVDKGQIEAARSLGFNQSKTFLFIVLPQAIKKTFPSIGNEFIVNIKDTAVLNVIGVVELYYVAVNAGKVSTYYFESMIIAACVYLILTYATSKVLNLIEHRMGLESKPLPSSN